jgi:putative lipoprotein
VPVLAALVALYAVAPAADPDPWFGRDKALHFAATSSLAAGGWAASALVTPRPGWHAVAGASLALAAGLGKELWDLSGRGDASWRDLTWDAVGTGAGLLVSWGVELAVRRWLLHEPAPEPAPAGAP